MSFLELFLIISGVVILLTSIDIAKEERFRAFHFFVFISIGLALIVFTVFPNFLTRIGHIFGLQRGADVLVYASIIFLIYFVLLLLRKGEILEERVTKLIREVALLNGSHGDKK